MQLKRSNVPYGIRSGPHAVHVYVFETWLEASALKALFSDFGIRRCGYRAFGAYDVRDKSCQTAGAMATRRPLHSAWAPWRLLSFLCAFPLAQMLCAPAVQEMRKKALVSLRNEHHPVSR